MCISAGRVVGIMQGISTGRVVCIMQGIVQESGVY